MMSGEGPVLPRLEHDTFRRRPTGRKNDADRLICRFCCHSSVGYTQTGGIEEFSGLPGFVLLVENVRRKRSKRTKSWVEQSGVAQKRLRFVFSNFSGAGSDWAR